MKNLLYIGNKLSEHGNTATAIEVLGPLLVKEGYHVDYASSKQSKLLRFAGMMWATFANRNKVGFVLIDTYSTWNFWYAFGVSQLCRALRLKYIPILHGGNLPHRLDKNPRLSRMVFSHAHTNVAPSGYLLQEFSKRGYTNVSGIRNPVETSGFPFLERQQLAPRLLWVRSFAEIYNPFMALKVIEVLQAAFPNAELCMVGPDKEGLLAGMKQEAASKNLNVTFTGRLSKVDWAKLSERFDIFINTAHIDNAPFTIIEAAALGMAVVSTNVGGIPYLMEDGHSAILVEDNDHQAMVAAVRDLVTNHERATRLILNSRRTAHESDWNSVRKQWLEILT